eukprot:gb/GECG01009657.1/.p1 GENE.gb/GECG01009657.1/~~gb/GECG01009657.1/.p1  ORF type:complete len:155 (+),score=14.75 gb/GECG01009657.1/:1-465(+)
MELVSCPSADKVRTALEQDKDSRERRLIESLNESFPVGDFVAISPKGVGADYDFFQSTISNEHPLTEYGLKQLENLLPKSTAKIVIRLFFCVPPSRFPNPNSALSRQDHKLKFRPIYQSNQDATPVACPHPFRIEQFGLKVDPGVVDRSIRQDQ